MADPTSPSLQFPRSSGLMSERVRDHDWAATPLGPIADWPVALRLTVDMMLASHFPKCLVWGPRLITIHNDAFLPILGAKPAALGRPFSDVWREAWDVIGPIARRAFAGEATFVEDLPLTIHRNGYDELAHFTFCYSPVRDESGAVVGLMDTVIETTGKHVAQKDLHALAASLEQQVAERTADRNRLWQLSGDVLLVTRRDGTIVSANPAWTSILGWTQEHTEGQPLERFVHPLDALRLQTEVIDPQEPLARREASLRFIHRDGNEAWIAWAAVSGDGFIHFVGRDVTKERANFQALALAEEQLRQSQKMDAIGQLTGGIAHDFNNMLQGIVLPLQLIGKRVAQGQLDEVPRYADAALAAAKRAAALTQRLLAFSRRQPLDSRPANLAASLRSLEPMLANTCGENMVLQFDLQNGLWPAFTDVHQFESAVLNLAINARDAMPQGGRLSVVARNVPAQEAEGVTALAPGDYVCVCVCDTGQGMSPAVQERAFDPFFTTKPLGQGTGLGLSMIYGYLRQSGGVATLDSAEGQGTCVSLYFPRSHADPQDDTPQPLANTASPRRPFSTLVVEDDTTVRTFAVELLRDMGFHVMAASNGNEAMALLSGAIHFDLLVSDVGLPGPNGRQVADYARERLPAIKVLLMTGYAEQAAMNASFLGTQMELLVKPFDAQALVAKVHHMVGLAPPETAAR